MRLFDIQFGFSIEAKGANLPLVKQIHGRTVREVTSLEMAQTLRRDPPEADGVWTRVRELEVSVHTADCASVLLFSRGSGPVAAVHAGWRGVMQGVIRAQIEPLSGELHAILGPCLRTCCFEVQDDFVATFSAARGSIERYLSKREHRRYFDMVKFILENELQDLPPENIHLENARCTFCSVPQLPSYRRNGNTDPRIRAWIRRD